MQQNIQYIFEIHSNLILAKKKINEECKIKEQCSSTENANMCFAKGKDEKEKKVCTCNNQYNWINGKCLKGMV